VVEEPARLEDFDVVGLLRSWVSNDQYHTKVGRANDDGRLIKLSEPHQPVMLMHMFSRVWLRARASGSPSRALLAARLPAAADGARG